MRKEILLAFFQKITHKRYQNLITVFSNLDNVWKAEFSDFKNKLNWEENFIHEFLIWRDEIKEEKIIQILEKEKIHCLCINEENYPPLLKEIYDPPFCIFVKGNLGKNELHLGVVGTRKFTKYGQQITNTLIPDLVNAGLTIVSGLALGIDGIAHDITLANNGKTVAVLGTGIDRQHIYPSFHRYLSDKIIYKGGAIISEYPPGYMGAAFTFPRRNRIIAGLSLGTLVIEAPLQSGSLITAQCALDSNREVFAVPQNITSPTSEGVNNLIKMGAKLVTSSQDILESLHLKNIQKSVENKKITADSPTEEKILNVLSKEPQHIDQITKASGLQSPVVSSNLTIMEIKGKAKSVGGMMYVIG